MNKSKLISIEEMHELTGFGRPIFNFTDLIKEGDSPVRKLCSPVPNIPYNVTTTKELINVCIKANLKEIKK